eukprot:TRINITY_DN11487_c0_g1_i6.p1 TRINITY_DN11487_c0_g1~~TRINITY_DN11487_c0_g1_i6.p1  ORF type:complete len:234 (-),score=40.84 TRINITY_DN11487_c0_g1_i6:33-734(-)
MTTTSLFETLVEDESVHWFNCYSPALVPSPKDYPQRVKTVGYLWLDDEEDYQPPAKLKEFLQHGPPVYFGFGSMKFPNFRSITKMILDAIKQTNTRAILCEGWGSLQKPTDWDENATENANILFVDDVSHSYLFPLCSAAVIHGGAGTTSAAIRAGIPIQIIPFLVDQPFWAARTVSLGVGLPPISCSSLTKDHVVNFLSELETNENLRINARALSKLVMSDSTSSAFLDLLR